MAKLRRDGWRYLAAVCCLTIAVGPFALAGYSVWNMQRQFDYDRRDPASVYREFFHQPVPAGATGMRVAGFGSLGGSCIWMRWHATDAAAKGPPAHSRKRHPVRSIYSGE